MSSQSANVIDLQSHRARRSADRAGVAAKPGASADMPTAFVAWVPVWFMPVAFFGMPVTTN